MDDMRLLSTEAEGVQEAIPEENRHSLVNPAGRVGALLGLRPDEGNSCRMRAEGSLCLLPGCRGMLDSSMEERQ
jgi:hypothetical protein